jgi:hypothetical protein
MLTKQNFEKATTFIKENARPLEKALYNFYFENGSVEQVLLELSKYQNEDGGFGHALESDVRLAASNQLATSVAFQILSELNIGPDNHIVKRAIDYLARNYKAEFKGWLFLPPEVDAVPRAIWWNYDANENNNYNCNPSAEIAGYLARYRNLAPQNIVDEAVTAAIDYLKKNYDTLTMHDIFCYQRLAKELSPSEKTFILDLLRKILRKNTTFDNKKWCEYGASPLSYINSPAYELADIFTKEELDANFDYIIHRQQEDGSWLPNWNWCRFEEEWDVAKMEWMGVITLNNLKILNSFNQIIL